MKESVQRSVGTRRLGNGSAWCPYRRYSVIVAVRACGDPCLLPAVSLLPGRRTVKVSGDGQHVLVISRHSSMCEK